MRHIMRKLTDFEYDALISEVQCRPCLWDDRHDDFKNAAVTRAQWEEVGNIINLTGNDCKKKWKNLKDTFRKKVQKSSKSPSSSAFAKWKFQESLEFVREVLPCYVGEPTDHSGDDADTEMPDTKEAIIHQLSVACPEDEEDRTTRTSSFKRKLRGEEPSPKRTVETSRCGTNSAVMKRTYDENEDHHFFLSLLPYMGRLDDMEKLHLRAKIQNCVLEALSEHEDARRAQQYSSDNDGFA